MPTKLYFEATNVPDITPAFDAGWTSTTEAVRRNLRATQQAATETRAGTLAAGVNSDLIVQLISPPLSGAQTVSGTATIVSRGRELAAQDNINNRPRVIKVVSGDGNTVRGTPAPYTNPASTTELITSLAGQQHMTNGSLTSVSALDGDRIVVEIGYRASVGGTTPEWEMVLGGTGTDHGSASNNDVTGTVPWLEFSAALVFQAAAAEPWIIGQPMS